MFSIYICVSHRISFRKTKITIHMECKTKSQTEKFHTKIHTHTKDNEWRDWLATLSSFVFSLVFGGYKKIIELQQCVICFNSHAFCENWHSIFFPFHCVQKKKWIQTETIQGNRNQSCSRISHLFFFCCCCTKIFRWKSTNFFFLSVGIMYLWTALAENFSMK